MDKQISFNFARSNQSGVNKEHSTHQLILEAALAEFHAQGFKGARTTRIAEKAGISRTMLHYHFSTKEALFEAVLQKTFGSVLSHLVRLADAGTDIFQFCDHLIEVLSDLLEEHPGLPSFIVNILNESPELILNLAGIGDEKSPALLDSILEKARAEGRVRASLNGEQLLIHIWGLCSAPYLISPYIAAREQRDAAAMRAFIRARRSEIKVFVRNGMQ
jgi:TetR/AcrR family transcriptional regulator